MIIEFNRNACYQGETTLPLLLYFQYYNRLFECSWQTAIATILIYPEKI